MTKSNKRLLTFIIPLVIFAVLIVMLFTRLGKPTDIEVSRVVGKPLPAFNLPLLSDTTRMMSNQDLPKQPFLLNVWGSWCPTCYAEHPFLLKLREQGVLLVGVNYKDELANALDYLNKYQDPFLYSVQDLSGQYALDLGITGAPESYVVGDDGIVYKHIVGMVDDSNWEAIAQCLQAVRDKSLDSNARLQACK